MTEWIEHDGKGMPVDAETKVIVRFRNGIEEDETDAWDACLWEWENYGDGSDIVAYRVIE